MNRNLRTGLLLASVVVGSGACTSIFGGFDYEGGSTASASASSSATGTGGAGTTSTTATTVTTGTGGMTASSSTGSGGAGGMCAEPCTQDADCKTTTTVCAANKCDKTGCCALAPLVAGTDAGGQAGTCHKNVCDGTVGGTMMAPDSGACQLNSLPAVCGDPTDASVAGTCVACNVTADCTQPATACASLVCAPSHACKGGPNAAPGAMCNDNGGTICDGQGMCIACAPGTARLIAPLSTTYVTSRQPALHWAAAAQATSYIVELCSDPFCSTIITSLTTVGATTATPAAPLNPGVVFWRVRALGPCMTTTSLVWEFLVGHRSAPKDTYISGPPDFNRDGHPDAAIGSASGDSEVYLNMGTGLSAAPAQKVTGGRSMAYAGDVNGDGFGDLIVGEFQSNKAYIYHGNVNGVALGTLVTGPAMSMFGYSVAGVGDVNGDGYADVVIGLDDISATSMLYLGGPNGINTTPVATLAGSPVAGAGDVNGDGYADVIVGDRLNSVVSIYHGGPGGLTLAIQINKPATEALGSFGESVAGAGDVNGDGYADVLVAVQGTTRAYLFYGGPTGILATGATVVNGASGGGAGVISSLAHAGDVNGDGYSDVIIGAYNGEKVIIYHGGMGGLSTVAGTTLSYASGQYAQAVASLGDVDGDGYADVIAAPSQCSGFPILAYKGSSSGIVAAPTLYSYMPPNGEQCFGTALSR